MVRLAGLRGSGALGAVVDYGDLHIGFSVQLEKSNARAKLRSLQVFKFKVGQAAHLLAVELLKSMSTRDLVPFSCSCAVGQM